uniref:Uncharacterized protein n=1 Tax=Candidatus Kentrum sp. LFY TaxID=2126342 RepID=A0A450UCC8_9GAMM|nr:MAG: hypothetical protein BECKLFY1418B_GA0070995_10183 [Candidatus Kentron sp. LFY]VFK20436.1 MAG: hypothetical protein BECKLFY1418C_GA0070996_107216 [Candidatus Kentron sp. LFY]
MSVKGKNGNPVEEVKNIIWVLLTRWFGVLFGRGIGSRLLITIAAVSVAIGWALEIKGHTLTVWHYFSTLFAERTSVLSGEELEIANEWVIYVDSGAEFVQVDAHRNILFDAALQNGGAPWQHFTRNLRTVRDPRSHGNWLLVADLNLGVSTKAQVTKTIDCVKAKVENWAELDTFGSSIEHSYAIRYRIDDFIKTYGRPKNIKYVRSPKGPDPKDVDPRELSCPAPYN